MIRAILFDCFGVLYPDTFWTIARHHLGTDFSGKEQELHDLVRKVDLGYCTRDELWGTFGELVGKTKDQVYEELKTFSGLDVRLLEYIELLKKTYKIGMISNVGHGFIEQMFTSKPASHYFDTIVLSSDVGIVKPDVRIYQLAAKKLGVSEESCVFIDDLDKNVHGARNAGMQAIHYTHFQAFLHDLQDILVKNTV